MPGRRAFPGAAARDHWHAMMPVLARQAGKDVYVEQPASHNVVEGRRMVEAARRYRRVVQVGMQLRSSSKIAELIQMVIGPQRTDRQKPLSHPAASHQAPELSRLPLAGFILLGLAQATQ